MHIMLPPCKCRRVDKCCSLHDRVISASVLAYFEYGDRESQISRSVLNSWCNDTIQDAARHVVELEGDVSVLRNEKVRLQQRMAEKEEEWMEAESQLRVQFLGEKRELQRSCMEKELVVWVKLGAERDAVAADWTHCD